MPREISINIIIISKERERQIMKNEEKGNIEIWNK